MNFSEDHLTVSAVQTKDSLPIPVDLIINIFSRLPAKSVARFRFLSKFWSDVIRSQYFIDLFAVNSSAQPQILFVNKDKTGFSFLSAHQPSDDPFDNITPTCLSQYPEFSQCCSYGAPVNGLVCLTKYFVGMCKPLIYNPSTGESLTLPEARTHRNTENLLGYDPTEKQFKVLSLNYDDIDNYKEDGGYEYFFKIRVLTLETEELSWRTIECSKSHNPFIGVICINGVLYYRARCASSFVDVIVCFHVRSETFTFINVMETFNKERLPSRTFLTNYDGKLGLLLPEESNSSITGESKSFELWFLKDAERHEWSQHVYPLPPVWKDLVGKMELRFVGMMGTTEIVLSVCCPWKHTHGTPYIFFYNIKKNIIRGLNIQDLNTTILLGYDPTEKQFKVLSLNYGYTEGGSEEILESQVLTFETEKLSWRMIECSKSHSPLPGEICINGVLYYRATCASSNVEVIVCFHVRSETFTFINVMETFNKERLPSGTFLTNYDGKLGLLLPEESNSSITGESKSFELWFLKDAERHEWSQHVYPLPPVWKDLAGKMELRFVGMMGTTEIVLSDCSPWDTRGTPDIFSYNIKKNIIRGLNIQGGLKPNCIFLNYVEDVSLYKLLN